MDDKERKWSPKQWAKDDDNYPELPGWADTIDMIRRTFGENFCKNMDTVVLKCWGSLPANEQSLTIATLAYGCLRGLTVRETLRYFGKEGRSYPDYRSLHPIGAFVGLMGSGGGDDPMSKYVSFPNNVNPLAAIAA